MVKRTELKIINQNGFILLYKKSNNALTASIESGCTELDLSYKGWYVYFLIDSRDSSIFYVGKGKNDRIYHHIRKSKNETNQLKMKRIEAIEGDGHKVDYLIFDIFKKEDDAYDCERRTIKELVAYELTNISGGFVSEKEKIKAGFERLLSRILNKEKFLSEIEPEKRTMLNDMFGSPSIFYDKFLNEVHNGILNPTSLTFKVNQQWQ